MNVVKTYLKDGDKIYFKKGVKIYFKKIQLKKLVEI